MRPSSPATPIASSGLRATFDRRPDVGSAFSGLPGHLRGRDAEAFGTSAISGSTTRRFTAPSGRSRSRRADQRQAAQHLDFRVAPQLHPDTWYVPTKSVQPALNIRSTSSSRPVHGRLIFANGNAPAGFITDNTPWAELPAAAWRRMQFRFADPLFKSETVVEHRPFDNVQCGRTMPRVPSTPPSPPAKRPRSSYRPVRAFDQRTTFTLSGGGSCAREPANYEFKQRRLIGVSCV